MNVSPYLHDGVFVELTAVGNKNNGVNCDATWSRVMTKKKECEVAVLAILDASDSEPIVATIACHRIMENQKECSKVEVGEQVNQQGQEG